MNYELFSCVEHYACYYHCGADNVIERYLLAENYKGQQHHKDQACAFEHIGGAEVNTAQHLLPINSINAHHSDCTAQAQQVWNRHKRMLRCVFGE